MSNPPPESHRLPLSEVVADFTRDDDPKLDVECGSQAACKGFRYYKPGYKLVYMKGASGDGRQLCKDCHDHYTTKYHTSRRQSDDSHIRSTGKENKAQYVISGPGVDENDAQIYRNVNAAKRREPVSLSGIGSMGPPAVPPYASQQPYPHVASVAGASASHGYTASHRHYADDLKKYQSKAYVVHGGYTGSIDAKLMQVVPTTGAYQLLKNCFDIIPEVPIFLSANALFKLAFDALSEKYLKFICSGQNSGEFPRVSTFPLTATDVLLANSNRIPIKMDSIDTISDHFFATEKSGARGKFKTNCKPFKVLLILSGDWLERFTAWKSQAHSHPHVVWSEGAVTAGSKRKLRSSPKSMADSNADEDEDYSMMVPPQHPPKKKLCLNVLPTALYDPTMAGNTDSESNCLPSTALSDSESKSRQTKGSSSCQLTESARSRLREALASQVKPTAEAVTDLVRFRSPRVQLRLLQHLSLEELIDATTSTESNAIFSPEFVVTTICIDMAQPVNGAFKKGFFGYFDSMSLPSPLPSGATQICIKETYYKKKSQMHAYGAREQAARLTLELKCNSWASALMAMTLDFVKEKQIENGVLFKPTRPIPSVRIVNAALALEERIDDPNKGKIWMVEERIDGDFKKWIHNGSATIPHGILHSEDDMSLSLFFSFSQHVQYLQTDGQAYISDFQGGRSSDKQQTVLLTDLQILTHPDLGKVFADGNLSSSFEAFEVEHECNSYCTDFGLDPFGSDLDESQLE